MIKLLQFGFEGLLVLVIIWAAYAQVLRPLMTGTPVFPMFRKRPNLEREAEETTEALEDKAARQVLDRKKKKLGSDSSAGSVGKNH